MLEWIIIGGGIQGTTMAAYLLKSGKTTVDQLAIVDRNEEPLARWKHCTEVISMPYLRSPSVHHLDVNPFSLQKYVGKADWNNNFYGQYKRPSLQSFNEHCDHLTADLMIKQVWVQGKVISASQIEKGWEIQLENGSKLEGCKLVISIGIGEQLHLPDWAQQLKQEHEGSIFHIFDENIPEMTQLQGPITIIGGGISSVHLALKLSKIYPNEVTLLKRHPFRIHDFDSDPGWLGPKNQRRFRAITSYQKRRETIIQARNKGSIPADLHKALMIQVKQGLLRVMDVEVISAVWKDGHISLLDKYEQLIQQTGTILLATGFKSSMPGKDWLLPVIQSYDLRCAECGYPIVSQSLQWGPGLYVTGALAELEMGPISRNISGARQAAERIVNSL
ncbi:FAD/NAD(P)-binding protein [Peribacillus butanolivorans]|uniref:FAD/NAD(P)-binding protein n=1 Tax=Peribacillus butanolivorans TaxID=421767 RepID=UPI002E1CC58E|nr:FAD/NAD(P)-binding protein [Peribacillus butanolivorans]